MLKLIAFLGICFFVILLFLLEVIWKTITTFNYKEISNIFSDLKGIYNDFYPNKRK